MEMHRCFDQPPVSDMETLSIGAYILRIYDRGEMLRWLVEFLKQSSS